MSDLGSTVEDALGAVPSFVEGFQSGRDSDDPGMLHAVGEWLGGVWDVLGAVGSWLVIVAVVLLVGYVLLSPVFTRQADPELEDAQDEHFAAQDELDRAMHEAKVAELDARGAMIEAREVAELEHDTLGDEHGRLGWAHDLSVCFHPACIMEARIERSDS